MLEAQNAHQQAAFDKDLEISKLKTENYELRQKVKELERQVSKRPKKKQRYLSKDGGYDELSSQNVTLNIRADVEENDKLYASQKSTNNCQSPVYKDEREHIKEINCLKASTDNKFVFSE